MLELYQAQRDATEMRVLIMEKARETIDPEVLAAMAGSLAKVICAWSSLEERKRIMLGKPLPGSLRPGAGRMKQARQLPETILEADTGQPIDQPETVSEPDPGDFDADASPKADANDAPPA